MPGIDSYTKLCIVSDGVIGGETTFTDLSLSGHTIYAEGDINHSTADPLFGFTAIESDGTEDALYVDPSTDWEFGTGDYTLEIQLNTTVNQGTLFNCTYYHNAETNTWSEIVLLIDSSGHVYFSHEYTNNGSLAGYRRITSTTDIRTGDYNHIELVRISGIYKLFIVGTSEGSVTSSGSVVSLVDNGYDSHYMFISKRGMTGTTTINGYFDQIRISKGIARHTTNFTPPTETFDDKIHGTTEFNTPVVSLESTGTFPTIGFVEFDTPAPWLSSIGNNPILGYGEFNAPLPSFTAAEMSLGYTEMDTPSVSLSATGSFPIYGWTEFDTKRVSLDASGINQVLGFVEFNTPKIVLSSQSGGDVLMRTSMVELTATGVMAYPGFGEINTPRVSLTSYGTQALYATVNITPQLPRLKSMSRSNSGFEVITYRR